MDFKRLGFAVQAGKDRNPLTEGTRMRKSIGDHPDMRRRSIVAATLGTISLAVSFDCLCPTALHAKRTSVGKINSMAQWMDAWTGVKAKDVNGGLYVFRFADPMWVLLRPIEWMPGAGEPQYRPVNVPKGFITDFASIPQAFYSLLPPDGNYSYAAVFHDYLYWTQERPREEVDDILKLAMQEFNISPIIVQTIYRAVRAFGGEAWKENAKLKANGEKRILIKFPEDPKTLWPDWKKQPGVFSDTP
jgi:Protein of unknown function (DUF1353)